MDSNAHNEHANHLASSIVPLSLAALAGGIIFAPFVIPLIAPGTGAEAEGATNIFHAHDGGTGWASKIQGGLGAIPGIGASLAAGGLTSILATAVIGIGGVMLANWMEKREDPHAGGIRWSKVIRYASLITSALIALPSILTGLSIGTTFLVDLFTNNQASINGVIAGLHNTFGGAEMAMGTQTGGAGLAAFTFSHLLTCGAAIAPLVAAVFLGKKQPETRVDAASAHHAKTLEKPLQTAAHAV